MSERMFTEILKDIETSDDMSTYLSPSWQQGRAAFGGLVASMAVAGMKKQLAEHKTLRSLLVNFVGPTPITPINIVPRVLREGKSVTQMAADVVDDSGVHLHASAAFGLPREAKFVPQASEFKPEPRESVPLMPKNMGSIPNFLKHFDIHWTGGGIPLSGMDDRRCGMWVKHTEDLSAYPEERIIALADMPPPIMLSHFKKLVRVSSLSWSLEFVRPPEEVTSDWMYLDYTLEAAANGYSQQDGRIFDEEGNLCAISRQCMVYFE